jgi:hypothetical protein
LMSEANLFQVLSPFDDLVSFITAIIVII